MKAKTFFQNQPHAFFTYTKWSAYLREIIICYTETRSRHCKLNFFFFIRSLDKLEENSFFFSIDEGMVVSWWTAILRDIQIQSCQIDETEILQTILKFSSNKRFSPEIFQFCSGCKNKWINIIKLSNMKSIKLFSLTKL